MCRPSEADYRLGKHVFDLAQSPADYARAANLIRRAANEGNPKAQTGLAVLYIKGLGVHQDQQEGLKWLRRAALQSFAMAQNELGVLYATGKGVPQDLNEAIQWCRKGADQGSKTAQKNLALMEAAKRNFLTVLTTREGKSYQNLTVQKITPDGIMVAFEPEKPGIGLARLKTIGFPDRLKELCGLTTPKAASPFSVWSLASAL